MKSFRLTALAFAVLSFILVACDTGNGALPLPGVTITDVNSSSLAPGDEVTVTGSGFYQTSVTALTQIDVCGVSVTASLVAPVSQLVVLPPGGTVTVETGSVLTFVVPEDGFVAGEGQSLVVTPPDGGTAEFAGVTCVAPIAADLSASSTTGVAPATIGFSAAGSTGEGELSFSWDFGDEIGTSTIAEPEYTYVTPGVFTVELTVSDETDATATATQVITVNSPSQDLANLTLNVLPPVPATMTVHDRDTGAQYDLGPDDYTLQGIPAGDYRISTDDYEFLNPTPPYSALYTAPSALFRLEPGEDRVINIPYEAISGSLELSDSGLPSDYSYADSELTLTPNFMPAGYGSDVDTSDWSNLIPGVYALDIGNFEVQREEEGNTWTEEYRPTDATQTILISSNVTTRQTIDYTVTPVASLGFGVDNGDLPEGALPGALLEDSQGQVQSDWQNLLPGPYLLTFNPVDHVNEGALDFEGETHDAFERYVVDDENPIALYLSSGEQRVIPEIPYELELALIDIVMTRAPIAAGVNVTITDAHGVQHQFININTAGFVRVPHGIYELEYTAPPGYYIDEDETTPQGKYLASRSARYGNIDSRYGVTIHYWPWATQ